MPTVVGIIFLALGIGCLVKREDWLLGFLMFSGLFQASSVINFGSFGIQPFYFAACLFLYSQARKNQFWRSGIRFRGKNLLLMFCCLGVFSALVYPFIFAGIPVYVPKVGIDDGFFYRPPLQFGLGNVAQATYLIVEVLTVWAAASALKTDKTRVCYDFCFNFLIGLVFVQFVCVRLGIAFPYSLFQTNPGYAMAEISTFDPTARVIGTFTEASGAGLVLVLFYAGYFYEYFSGTGSAFKVILAAVSIGLVRSSSALAAMLVTTVLILIFHPVFRFPWFIRGSRLAKLTSVLAVGVLIVLSPLNATLREYTTEKNETLSYIHRTAADLFSLQLTVDTHGIGVGLGSNRPSSLITSLLSNVGVLGTVIFVLLVIQVARNAQGEYAWIRWSLFAAVFDMCLGVPDITQPMLWVGLTLAVYYGTAYREGSESCSPRAAASRIPQVS
jgi:hypothetical protein